MLLKLLGVNKNNETERKKTELSVALNELQQAKEHLRIAEMQYDVCDIKFIDIASENVLIARQKLNLIIKKNKILFQEMKTNNNH